MNGPRMFAGAALLTILIVINLTRLADLAGYPSWIPAYTSPNPIAPLVSTGDGVTFALVAEDLTLSEPERLAPDNLAYRAQRILPAALAWALAAGQHQWIPYGMLALAAAGSLWMIYEAGLLAVRAGRSGWWGLAVIALPGSIANLEWLGAENLGFALVLFGLRSGWLWPHVFAGLVRETLLIPSLIIAVTRRDAGHLIPLGVFGAWAAIVRLRLGEWFFAIETSERIELLASPWALAALLALLLWRRPWGVYVAAYVPVVLLMGEAVWSHWSHVFRPLTPMIVFAAVAVFARDQQPGIVGESERGMASVGARPGRAAFER